MISSLMRRQCLGSFLPPDGSVIELRSYSNPDLDIDVLGDARIVANGEYSTEVILLNANESHFRL